MFTQKSWEIRFWDETELAPALLDNLDRSFIFPLRKWGNKLVQLNESIKWDIIYTDINKCSLFLSSISLNNCHFFLQRKREIQFCQTCIQLIHIEQLSPLLGSYAPFIKVSDFNVVCYVYDHFYLFPIFIVALIIKKLLQYSRRKKIHIITTYNM